MATLPRFDSGDQNISAQTDGPSKGPRHSVMYNLARAATRSLYTMCFNLRVYGADRVPAHGGLLLVSNHESFLDPPLVAVAVRRPISFFAKSELFENRLFGGLIRRLNAFPVRQGEADIGAIKEAIKRLKEGHALIVFPEGSRTPDGRFHSLQPGVGLMIRRAGVPVVPIAIDGSHQAWPRDRKIFRPYPLRIQIGEPMRFEHLKPEAIIERIDAKLRSMLTTLRSEPHPADRADFARRRLALAETDDRLISAERAAKGASA